LKINTDLVWFATEKYKNSNISINKIYIKGKNNVWSSFNIFYKHR
jgi:hypothetical protein